MVEHRHGHGHGHRHGHRHGHKVFLLLILVLFFGANVMSQNFFGGLVAGGTISQVGGAHLQRCECDP